MVAPRRSPPVSSAAAFRDGVFDPGGNSLRFGFGNEGSDIGSVIHWMTDSKSLRASHESLREFSRDVFRAHRSAALEIQICPLYRNEPGTARSTAKIQVRIAIDDQTCVAPEFERDSLQTGIRANLLPDVHAARERNHADAWIRNELGGRSPAPSPVTTL